MYYHKYTASGFYYVLKYSQDSQDLQIYPPRENENIVNIITQSTV